MAQSSGLSDNDLNLTPQKTPGGRPLGPDKHNRVPEGYEYSTNRSTVNNRKRKIRATTEELVEINARNADNSARSYAVKKLKEEEDWDTLTPDQQAFRIAATKAHVMEQRRGVNDLAYKIEHKEEILAFYKRIKKEEEDMEDEAVAKSEIYGKKKLFRPGPQISKFQDAEEYIDIIEDLNDYADETDGIDSQSPGGSEAEDTLLPIHDAEEKQLVMEEVDEEEDETLEQWVGEKEIREKKQQAKEEAQRYWRHVCHVWVPAMDTLGDKLRYIAEHVDPFEGDYSDLMHTGLLEVLVNMSQECQDRFAAHLEQRGSAQWSSKNYRVELWYHMESQEAEIESSEYETEDEEGGESSKERDTGEQGEGKDAGEAGGATNEAIVDSTKDAGEAGGATDEAIVDSTKDAGEADGATNEAIVDSTTIASSNASDTLLPASHNTTDTEGKPTSTTAEPNTVEKTAQDESQDFSYRNDPDFYIPVTCLFTRLEMSVLCNLASHTPELSDLEVLCIWPPSLSLTRSGIVPNRDAELAERAFNLLKDVQLDKYGFPPRPHKMTEDMQRISCDMDILTISKF